MQGNHATIHYLGKPILPITLYGIIGMVRIYKQKIYWFVEGRGYFVAETL